MDFSLWDAVLKKCILPGKSLAGVKLNEFNYTCLVGNSEFTNFGLQVEAADTTFTEFDNFKAFWMNTYNYLAVRTVFKNTCATDLFGDCQPLMSIRQIGQQQPSLLVNGVWDEKTLVIKSYNNGKAISLNDIEVGNLRNPPKPWKEDPRIHGCINCASVSCPDLQLYAYQVTPKTTAANVTMTLDEQMDHSMSTWLANPKKGSAIIGNDLYVSKIFDFFPEDFNSAKKDTDSKDIYTFLAQHGPADVQNFLKKHARPGLNYFNYDWNLNGNVKSLCSVDRPCFPWWALLTLILGLAVALFIIILVRRRFTAKRAAYDPLNSTLYDDDVYYDD
eukprot:TRINITY_DN153_c0_g1_i1.p2 TRINITY_DN153_c0_g1~~TRINITY_DN153_c0_g1_i1.p2  ORF type:complete len:386 (+),score=75.64 TRINITY_DN153_c0_g1_i1:165-1160(+)